MSHGKLKMPDKYVFFGNESFKQVFVSMLTISNCVMALVTTG